VVLLTSGSWEVSRKSKKFRSNDAPQSQEFRSGILVKKLRRLAIRAAKFDPEADSVTWRVSEIHRDGISVVEKNEGPLRGQ